jgi:phosphoglycolate phosphatase-like HAD superfamily hydrolase
LKKLLLFDIDGTLLRAEGATHKAITRTFHELFAAEKIMDVRSLIGATDRGIFKDAAHKILGRQLSAAEMKAVEKRYLELLPGELAAANFSVKPGVKQLLPLLCAGKDIIMGLETGNLEKAAYMKLRRGELDDYFKFGGFGSDSESRPELVRKAIARAQKRSAETIMPENTFIIGDAPNDIKAGKEIGIVTIAVGTGLLPREEVLAAKPDYFLDDLSDIPAFMKIIGCGGDGKAK